MKTVTYDDKKYKLVPVSASNEMMRAFFKDYTQNSYASMLAAVPDQLPGVVVHEDSPYAYVLVDQGQVTADDYVDFERVELASEITPDEVARFDKAGRLDPLYLHPAPSQPSAEQSELDEWRNLKDAAILHINLLRGFPAKLSESQLKHLLGDSSQPSAEALVQAALEAAALACDEISGVWGRFSDPSRSLLADQCAQTIRALSAQQIIESCKGEKS